MSILLLTVQNTTQNTKHKTLTQPQETTVPRDENHSCPREGKDRVYGRVVCTTGTDTTVRLTTQLVVPVSGRSPQDCRRQYTSQGKSVTTSKTSAVSAKYFSPRRSWFVEPREETLVMVAVDDVVWL